MAVRPRSKIRASPRSAHHCRAKPPLVGLHRPTSTDRKVSLEDTAPCSNTAQCHSAQDDLAARPFWPRSARASTSNTSKGKVALSAGISWALSSIFRGKHKTRSLGDSPAWLYMTCVVLRTCGVSPRIWHRTECLGHCKGSLTLLRLGQRGLQEQAAPQAHRKDADLRNLQVPGRVLDQPQEASRRLQRPGHAVTIPYYTVPCYTVLHYFYTLY